MSDFENTSCLVCGNNDYLNYSDKGQFGLPTHVVICKACGFSYLNPRWTEQRYHAFYTKEYDTYYRPEVITQNDASYRYEPIRKILKRFEERKIKMNFKSVLDIGSGMGHALIYLKKEAKGQGDFDAIEPSEHCKQHLLENGIHYLDNNVYGNWDHSPKKYELVIMRHVLEHFHDPLTVLKKAASVLAPDGILYVAVPDAFHPTKPLRSHFFRIVHISYFSKHSLTSLLAQAGLQAMHMAEGDQYERSEVFAICKKTEVNIPKNDPAQFELQKGIYDKAGSSDTYYKWKGKLVDGLRKIKLIK